MKSVKSASVPLEMNRIRDECKRDAGAPVSSCCFFSGNLRLEGGLPLSFCTSLRKFVRNRVRRLTTSAPGVCSSSYQIQRCASEMRNRIGAFPACRDMLPGQIRHGPRPRRSAVSDALSLRFAQHKKLFDPFFAQSRTASMYGADSILVNDWRSSRKPLHWTDNAPALINPDAGRHVLCHTCVTICFSSMSA